MRVEKAVQVFGQKKAKFPVADNHISGFGFVSLMEFFKSKHLAKFSCKI
jgi:hypothetical protein